MKTIEKAAEDLKRDYLENNICEGAAEDAAKCFLMGSEYALSHQWISVKEELPNEHHIWKHDENWTDSVLCEDSNGNYFFNRMLKRHGKWIWMHLDARRVKYWMPIPKRGE